MKNAATPAKKQNGSKQSSTKKNTSILSFFQKTDSPPVASSRQPRITQFGIPSTRSPSSGRGTSTPRRIASSIDDANEELFLKDKKGMAQAQNQDEKQGSGKARSPTPDIWGDDEEFIKQSDKQNNENGSAAKRRKLDTQSNPADKEQNPYVGPKTIKRLAPTKSRNQTGPFIDESDCEDDMEMFSEIQETSPTTSRPVNGEPLPVNNIADAKHLPEPTTPPLVRATTCNVDHEEYTNFDDPEDEDELIAEEFRNRVWEAEEQYQHIDLDIRSEKDSEERVEEAIKDEINTCPICQTVMENYNQAVSTHSSLHASFAHAHFRKCLCM